MGDKLRIPGPDKPPEDGGDDGGGAQAAPDRLGWEFVFDFRGMVGELEEDGRFTDVEWTLWDPIPDFTIATIEHGIGREVDERITALYRLTDGLELSWGVPDGADGASEPAGGIELFGFATVFDTWLDELWPTDGEGADDELLWSLRGFDAIGDPELGLTVALCVEEDYPTYDLFLHDPERREAHLLAVDFRTYLEGLLESRGVFGWQLLALEEAEQLLGQRPQWRRRAEQARRRIEQWFPQADWPP